MSARRFIPISESVVALAIKIAEREGMPLREFIERILSEVLKSMQYRSNITELLSLTDVMDDLRRVGGALLPSDIVYRVVEVMDDGLFNELLNTLRRYSSWYGMLIKVKRGVSVDVLKLVLYTWFPDTNVSISSEGEGFFKLVISSPKYSERLTRLIDVVITELCSSMGIKVREKISKPGIVSLVIEVR